MYSLFLSTYSNCLLAVGGAAVTLLCFFFPSVLAFRLNFGIRFYIARKTDLNTAIRDKEFARKGMEYPDFQSVEGCQAFYPANSRAVLVGLEQGCIFAKEKFVPKMTQESFKIAILDPGSMKEVPPWATSFPSCSKFHKALFILYF